MRENHLLDQPMKTKLRRITVDSVPYLWTLHKHNGDGDGGIELRVWRGKTVVVDEWLAGLAKPDAITPRFVATRIKTLSGSVISRGAESALNTE